MFQLRRCGFLTLNAIITTMRHDCGHCITWWRHQMETFSALFAIYAGNSAVRGEFPAQMPVTLSFDVCFDLRLNKRLSKQSWGWWFQLLPCPLWRHSDGQEAICFNSLWGKDTMWRRRYRSTFIQMIVAWCLIDCTIQPCRTLRSKFR